MRPKEPCITQACTLAPRGKYDCIYYMRPEWLTIRHNDVIASCCDKISNVNETENNSGELTDKYRYNYHSVTVCVCVCLSVYRRWSGDGDDGPTRVPATVARAVRTGRRRLSRDECVGHPTGAGCVAAVLVHLRVHRRPGQGLPPHRPSADAHPAQTEPGQLARLACEMHGLATESSQRF